MPTTIDRYQQENAQADEEYRRRLKAMQDASAQNINAIRGGYMQNVAWLPNYQEPQGGTVQTFGLPAPVGRAEDYGWAAQNTGWRAGMPVNPQVSSLSWEEYKRKAQESRDLAAGGDMGGAQVAWPGAWRGQRQSPPSPGAPSATMTPVSHPLPPPSAEPTKSTVPIMASPFPVQPPIIRTTPSVGKAPIQPGGEGGWSGVTGYSFPQSPKITSTYPQTPRIASSTELPLSIGAKPNLPGLGNALPSRLSITGSTTPPETFRLADPFDFSAKGPGGGVMTTGSTNPPRTYSLADPFEWAGGQGGGTMRMGAGTSRPNVIPPPVQPPTPLLTYSPATPSVTPIPNISVPGPVVSPTPPVPLPPSMAGPPSTARLPYQGFASEGTSLMKPQLQLPPPSPEYVAPGPSPSPHNNPNPLAVRGNRALVPPKQTVVGTAPGRGFMSRITPGGVAGNAAVLAGIVNPAGIWGDNIRQRLADPSTDPAQAQSDLNKLRWLNWVDMRSGAETRQEGVPTPFEQRDIDLREYWNKRQAEEQSFDPTLLPAGPVLGRQAPAPNATSQIPTVDMNVLGMPTFAAQQLPAEANPIGLPQPASGVWNQGVNGPPVGPVRYATPPQANPAYQQKLGGRQQNLDIKRAGGELPWLRREATAGRVVPTDAQYAASGIPNPSDPYRGLSQEQRGLATIANMNNQNALDVAKIHSQSADQADARAARRAIPVLKRDILKTYENDPLWSKLSPEEKDRRALAQATEEANSGLPNPATPSSPAAIQSKNAGLPGDPPATMASVLLDLSRTNPTFYSRYLGNATSDKAIKANTIETAIKERLQAAKNNPELMPSEADLQTIKSLTTQLDNEKNGKFYLRPTKFRKGNEYLHAIQLAKTPADALRYIQAIETPFLRNTFAVPLKRNPNDPYAAIPGFIQ